MIRLDNTSEQSIINMLRENNALSGQQIKQIENLSKESGKSQIETAFELNITNESKVAELLSESFSIPLVKLDDVKVDNNLKKFTEIRFLKEIISCELDMKTNYQTYKQTNKHNSGKRKNANWKPARAY